MRVLGTCLVVLGASGCAQIFGLDDSLSGKPPLVTESVVRYSIATTVTRTPMDLTASQASFVVPDASSPTGFLKIPASLTPQRVDQWQAEVALDVNASVFATYAEDGIIRHSAIAQRAQSRLFATLNSENAEPVPAAAQLAFNVALDRAYAAGDALQWYSVGSWTQHLFAGAELPAVGAAALAPPPIDFVTSTAFGRRQRLLQKDALLVLRHNAGTLTGVLEAKPFDMAGGPNDVTGTMLAVTADQAMAVSLDTTATAARLANVRPAYPTVAATWLIAAAPAGAEGFANGPTLATAAVAPNTGVVPVTASYGNPFAARTWPATLVWQVAATREYTPAGQPPVTLVARFTSVLAPPTDNTVLAAPSCLPTSVAVQGATLISDGLVVTLDRKQPVNVSFVVDTAMADLYRFQLIEVGGDATATALAIRFESVGLQPSWSVPSEIFQGGKTYLVRASCSLGGTPRVAEGDLSARAIPIHSASVDSGVFTVAQ